MSDDDFVEIEHRGRMLSDVGNGLRGPAFVDVLAHLPEFPGLDIRARIEPINAIYEVTRLELKNQSDGVAVPPQVLRQIPLRTIIKVALRSMLLTFNVDSILTPGEGADLSDEANGHRNVALTYRVAMLIGDPPTEAVAKGKNISRATAARRVAAARKDGFLGADEIGQAGGAKSRLGR